MTTGAPSVPPGFKVFLLLAVGYDLGPIATTPNPRFIMAGLSKDIPRPTEIKLHQNTRVLEISFDDGKTFELSCELLRVYSPSAEVRGHGPGQEVLQVGKRDVTINQIEPVGTYAVQFLFSDGHDTGIYSWDLLYDYGLRRDEMWSHYLKRLEEAGASRDPALAPAQPTRAR